MARASGWKNPRPGGISSAMKGIFDSIGKYVDTIVCPAGTIRMTCSLVAESGWIIMTGQTVTDGRFLYPQLWDKIPSDWKSGNNIVFPDFRDRYPRAAASGAAHTDIGNLLGSHTTTLSEANLAAHDHTFTTGTQSASHVHTAGGGNIVVDTAGGGVYAGGIGGSLAGFTSTQSASHTHGTDTNDAGSGTAFNTFPASMYVQFQIRAF